jgi:hypothetical protein
MRLNKIYLFIYFGFIMSCKEPIMYEDKRICCFTYEVQGSFNGKNWQRNGWSFGAAAIDATQAIKDTSSIDYKCLDGLVDFSLGLNTKELFARESLVISDVSKKAKKYGVALTSGRQAPCTFSRDSIKASFIILAEDGDFIIDRYTNLDKKYPNSFEVLSYDSIKNEFKCKFDFAFIKATKIDPTYPDTLYLKGEYRIDGRYKN